MILRELFDNPKEPIPSIHNTPGNNHYIFKIDDRRYEIVIKVRFNRNTDGKIYTIDFAYLGDTNNTVDYNKRLDNTDFRYDAYMVLGTVVRFCEKYFGSKDLGWDDVIVIEPNTNSKEKLYKVFAQKLAVQIGVSWVYDENLMSYIIGRKHALDAWLEVSF